MLSKEKYVDVFQRAGSDISVSLGFTLFVVRGCDLWQLDEQKRLMKNFVRHIIN